MDYIHKFDIELDRDVYYAGEKLTGHVIVQNTENLKVQGIRLTLRGKVHVEWKIMRTGERRTVKQDHYYIDDKHVVWGKDKNEEGSVPILPRGNHRYPFQFPLPESALPCSFESKMATIRYYLRVVIDMPYASSPQGIKYFTIIGPHIDCMDDRFLTPQEAQDKRNNCCFCCGTGPLTLKATLDRSAYCCGENVRLKAEIQNNSDENVWLVCKLVQYIQYFINKGVLGLNKDTSHKVFEVEGSPVPPYTTARIDDISQQLQVPVMPPSLLHVCQNLEIFYSLKVFLHMEKTGDVLHIDFPITVGTIPFRIPNSPSPEVRYENAVSHVEGGIYISSEFQFGGVYMGDEDECPEEIVLYRPVYVCVPHVKINHSNSVFLENDKKSKDSSKEKLKVENEKKSVTLEGGSFPDELRKQLSKDATDKKSYIMEEMAKVNIEAEETEEKAVLDVNVESEKKSASSGCKVMEQKVEFMMLEEKTVAKDVTTEAESMIPDTAKEKGVSSIAFETPNTSNAVQLISVELEQQVSNRISETEKAPLSQDNLPLSNAENQNQIEEKTKVENEVSLNDNTKTTDTVTES